VSQVFFNSGLTIMFNQLITASPTTYTNLYVGLFTDSSFPAGTATLGSGLTEQTGTGYTRQVTTFSSPAIAHSYITAPVLTTTLSATATSGTQIVTLTSTTGLVVGMSIVVGSSAVKTIIGLPGANQVLLSSALSATQSSGATVTAGDAAEGMKSVGSQVTFGIATGTWTASYGFFIATASTGGTALYASSFADGSNPILSPNDTLKVTPTWVMAN
jgi:hypothetical protein